MPKFWFVGGNILTETPFLNPRASSVLSKGVVIVNVFCASRLRVLQRDSLYAS